MDATSREIAQALRNLGFRAEAVRRGLELTLHLASAPIVQRLRAALSALAPMCVRTPAPCGPALRRTAFHQRDASPIP